MGERIIWLWWALHEKNMVKEYLKNLFNFHKDLPFSAEKKKIENYKKHVCSIHNKENYVVHIRDLKQALSNGLILKI